MKTLNAPNRQTLSEVIAEGYSFALRIKQDVTLFKSERSFNRAINKLKKSNGLDGYGDIKGIGPYGRLWEPSFVFFAI